MIGLSVQSTEQEAARELFELCKTPWEFCRSAAHYEVLICTADPQPEFHSRLVLIFTAEKTAFDAENNLVLRPCREGTMMIHAEKQIPIYARAATFSPSSIDLLIEENSREPALFGRRTETSTVVRVGYNLFDEVHRLLTVGQPANHAGIATLELHLGLLRDLITRAGLPVVEIPPVPEGYDFMTCLTHDIDHPILRNHRWDHTMLGFLRRATIGSLISFSKGRLPLRSVLKNWRAAFRLPLVYFKLAKDFWQEFAHDYLEVETGLGATYFFIPEKGNPGLKADGSSAPMRACRYDLDELKPQLKAILEAGNEVGVHGLDAWRDVAAGLRERTRVAQAITPSAEIGIRMHWLYFDANSPRVLDQAGFSYDSTVGYNHTVGFRAGTAQVYRPLGTTQLLELPLHVMDTALFYPSYLNLSDGAAYKLVTALLDEVKKFGGVLTFNWHDRSLAPERLWGDFYQKLLREMKKRRAWFPTAAQAVAWFRKRRQATIEIIHNESGGLRLRGNLNTTDQLPSLKIRIHQPLQRAVTELFAGGMAAAFVDVAIDQTTELNFNLWT